MTQVAVIGAGTMGNGIAHVFAQHEWDTTLIDVRPEALEKGLATIKGNLERQVKKGTLADFTHVLFNTNEFLYMR